MMKEVSKCCYFQAQAWQLSGCACAWAPACLARPAPSAPSIAPACGAGARRPWCAETPGSPRSPPTSPPTPRSASWSAHHMLTELCRLFSLTWVDEKKSSLSKIVWYFFLEHWKKSLNHSSTSLTICQTQWLVCCLGFVSNFSCLSQLCNDPQ